MSGVWTIVLAGGHGTRLWPLSTRERPKQTRALVTGESMIAETIARTPSPIERCIVVTTPQLKSVVGVAVPGLPAGQIVAEPSSRHTAPAVLFGIREAVRAGATDVIILPADHHVTDNDGFREVIGQSLEVARTHEAIALLGIVPTRPETGFGWIEVGARPDGPAKVEGFHEKPNLERATEMLESGCYLLNAGIFCGPVQAFLAAYHRHLPGCRAWWDGGGWEQTERVSFDVGVLEKETGLWVLPLDVGWDDLGSWPALMRHHGGGRARSVSGNDEGRHQVWAPDHDVVLACELPVRVVLDGGTLYVMERKEEDT
ncbi:MAG: sugar phosphate nucleotidyltransferase [Myxococcota bacterium]